METIGFIGLGTMGKPMALNLIKAGYKLIVNDIDKRALDLLAAHGAQVEESYHVMAEKCGIVITMLPEAHHVEEVALGSNGLIDGIQEGFLLIDMSSIIPETSKKIQKAFSLKGADSLDAPVSGGPTGKITYYSAGTAEFSNILELMEMKQNYTALYSVSNNSMTLKTDDNNNGSYDDQDEINTFTRQ